MEVPLAQMLLWSRTKKGPRAFRFGSQKSVPLFEAEALITWSDATFGEALPEAAAAFAKAVRALKPCKVVSTRRFTGRTEPSKK